MPSVLMEADAPAARANGALGWRVGLITIAVAWTAFFAITLATMMLSPREADATVFTILVLITLAGAASDVPLLALIDRDGERPLLWRSLELGAGVLAASFALSLLNYALVFHLLTHSQPEALRQIARLRAAPGFPINVLFGAAAQYLLLHLVWASGTMILRAARERAALRLRTVALESEARAAKLRALLYQINPHFLFNALNSLSALVIARRNDAAEDMLDKLSAFLRQTLSCDPARDTTLGDEIATQQLYLAIEKARFPDRLRVEISVPPWLEDACVPALLLQPLVENAVKHRVAHAPDQVCLRIAAREEAGLLVLEVINDRPPDVAANPTMGTGTGLTNVAARLAARHGLAAELWRGVEGGHHIVRLTLPLVRGDQG